MRLFNWFVRRPTTLYGFLSGMFMSVATTALSNFELAADTPVNALALKKSAALSFGAACGWFFLGEYVTALKADVEKQKEGLGGDRADAQRRAIELIGKESGWKLLVLLAFTLFCSLSWPLL